MVVDDALIAKLEILSKLKLDEVEKELLKSELGSIVEMFATISNIDTTEVNPLRHITDAINVMRADVSHNGLNTEKGLKNAPVSYNPYFAVPKVIE